MQVGYILIIRFGGLVTVLISGGVLNQSNAQPVKTTWFSTALWLHGDRSPSFDAGGGCTPALGDGRGHGGLHPDQSDPLASGWWARSPF